MTEVDYCHRWHRVCEALYREHRQSNLARMDWHEFRKKHPALPIPPDLKHATDLEVKVLRKVVQVLVQQAVYCRIAVVDLGLLDLIDPLKLQHLPPSVYGAEPDPFEGNGICDNPPSND